MAAIWCKMAEKSKGEVWKYFSNTLEKQKNKVPTVCTGLLVSEDTTHQHEKHLEF